jgi:hypothetical protein
MECGTMFRGVEYENGRKRRCRWRAKVAWNERTTRRRDTARLVAKPAPWCVLHLRDEVLPNLWHGLILCRTGVSHNLIVQVQRDSEPLGIRKFHRRSCQNKIAWSTWHRSSISDGEIRMYWERGNSALQCGGRENIKVNQHFDIGVTSPEDRST